MGQMKLRHPKRSKSETSIGTTSEDSTNIRNVFFVCVADRISQTTQSKKHVFSAEYAEKLMQKHLSQKPKPSTIKCLEKGLHFHTLSDPKHKYRNFVLFGNIKHVFIFSLNPKLFMICIEEANAKHKKVYESFQGNSEVDVSRLCQLISQAKNSPNARLSVREPDVDPVDSDTLYRQSNEQSAYERLSGSNQLQGSESKYQSITLFNPDGSPRVDVAKPPTASSIILPTTSVEASPGRYTIVSPALKTYSVQGVAPDIRQSNAQSNANRPELQDNSNLSRNTVWSRPTVNRDYSLADLKDVFGNFITFVRCDWKGAIESSRGPVYLYSERVSGET